MMFWIAVGLGAVGFMFVLAAVGLVVVSRTPPERVADTLPPCPESPNCVCSRAAPVDITHHIEPFELNGNPSTAIDRIESLLAEQPNVRILRRSETYLHAEFTTSWLRFRDDVEFEIDAVASILHVRSASRVGRSDLGANRARVERLRQLWVESAK